MGFHAGDFRFQLDDTFVQLILGIAVQALRRELTGCVSAPPGEIVFVH